LKVFYLVVVAVVAFWGRNWPVLSALAALQGVLWLFAGVPLADFLRLLRRLSVFLVMLALTFAFFSIGSPEKDVWMRFPIGRWSLAVNQAGLILAALMSLRMLVVLMASALVQSTGRPEDFIDGLRGWMVPETAALVMGSTLALLGASPAASSAPAAPRKGRGDGSGGGRGGGRSAGGPLNLLGSLRKGDVGGLVAMIEGSLKDSRAHMRAHSGRLPAETLRDVAILSGLCALMLSAKIVKILPGIPFAPGYKIIVVVPLYILAATMTRLPWAATLAGSVVGIVSLLSGDGRYGVFELFKHITPGLIIDMASPLLRRDGRPAGVVACVVLGILASVARTTTILAVVFFVDGNAALYGFALLQGLSWIFFGGLGGLVSAGVLKSLGRLQAAAGE